MAITHGSTMPAFVNAGGAGSKPAPAAQLNHGGAVNAAPAIDIDTAGGAGSVPALAGPIDRRRRCACVVELLRRRRCARARTHFRRRCACVVELLRRRRCDRHRHRDRRRRCACVVE